MGKSILEEQGMFKEANIGFFTFLRNKKRQEEPRKEIKQRFVLQNVKHIFVEDFDIQNFDEGKPIIDQLVVKKTRIVIVPKDKLVNVQCNHYTIESTRGC